MFAIIQNNWKYIEAPEPVLLNLDNDSREQKNLIHDQPDIAEKMRKELMDFIQKTNAEDILSHSSEILSAADARQLQSLGYVGHVPASTIQISISELDRMKDPNQNMNQ